MIEDLLKNGASSLGMDLSGEEIDKFKAYLSEILFWNAKMNLTAIKKEDDIVVKHFLDSLLPLKVFPITSQSIVDIGAGAGLPGIPIKIVRSAVHLTLLESVGKKVDFLKHVIDKLFLSHTVAIWGRAEDVAGDLREKFDIAISRAVAPLNVLSEYCLPLTKVGGSMIALKSENIEGEIGEAQGAIKILGGKLKGVHKVKLPTTDIVRSIVIIEKISKTPEKYPRRAGTAKKKPL